VTRGFLRFVLFLLDLAACAFLIGAGFYVARHFIFRGTP